MVNKVILLGNLGKDPEVRWTANSKAVCTLSVATTEKFKDSNGEMQERTEWHNVTVWGKSAEACGSYLAKGRQVFVEGRLHYSTYDGKDGQKRYKTEVIAEHVRFLGGGGKREEAESAGPTAPDDDIPF